MTSPARASHCQLATAALTGILLCAVGCAESTRTKAPRGLSAVDLLEMNHLYDPQPSPDGKWIAYRLLETDLEASRENSGLWLVDAMGEREPWRLTTHESSASQPRWSPDGRNLYFVTPRSGSFQVWRLPLDGGEARQVTRLPLGVSGFALSPDGESLAVAMEVFPDCKDLNCTVERLVEAREDPSSARVYDRLYVRHWDTWKDGRRSHLFVVPIAGGEAVDVSRGLDDDVPSKPFGGFEEIAFSRDGKTIVFTARVEGANEAWSIDFDLYAAQVDGSRPPVRLTTNPAWDTQPRFSPDGKTLAYLAMKRPGYGIDRLRLVLRDLVTGQERVLTEKWDRSVLEYFFAPDGRTIYATAEDTGNVRLFAIAVDKGDVEELWGQGCVVSPGLAGEYLVFRLDTFDRPGDIYRLKADGSSQLERLTDVNRDRLADIDMAAYEQFSFEGWNRETVHGYVIKPVGYENGKQYPVILYIHGGPQGTFDNRWRYGYNPQTFAGAGYAVVGIDFHGSTGYDQNFTDSINRDWGGKPLEDLQKGWAAALERYAFLDGDRACAFGASYGGYMVNWINGRWPDAFKCLVNHAGDFNIEGSYFTTDELWFAEWEFGGPAYSNASEYNVHNPMRIVQQWKTPTLVTHGAFDFRVTDAEGLATFTALQRRGVPSRLVHFPDEGHSFPGGHNSIRWNDEVMRWLAQWTRN